MKNTNFDKFRDFIAFFRKNYGFMLSYGESNDLMPVGTFCIKSFLCNKNGTVSSDLKKVSELNEIMVELVKVEMTNNDFKEGDSEKIYIPFPEFLKLIKISEKNQDFWYVNFGEGCLLESICLLEEFLEDSLRKDINNSWYSAEVLTLNDINASYVSNGSLNGSNYSLAPYILGITKHLERKLQYSENLVENVYEEQEKPSLGIQR